MRPRYLSRCDRRAQELTDDSRLQLADFDCGRIAADLNARWPFGDGEVGVFRAHDGRGAFQDPTHVSFWNSHSFCYYTHADQNRFIDCPVRFQASRPKNFFPSEWHQEMPVGWTGRVDQLPPIVVRSADRTTH